MCDSCGCHVPTEHDHSHHSHSQPKTVDVHTSLLAANDALAKLNREHFEAMGAVAINLISSPGYSTLRTTI